MLEWISFPNEVHSRMKFALHSQDTIDGAKVFAPAQKSYFITISLSHFERHACTTRPRLHSLLFSFQNEVCFQFRWHHSKISYQNEKFIWIKNWNELIPEWLIRRWNFDSVSCKQTKRNIWNEFVPEWVILVSCKQSVKQFSLQSFTNRNIQN